MIVSRVKVLPRQKRLKTSRVTNGSSIARYDELSTLIERNRLPIGSEIITKLLNSESPPAKTLADLGCGTGLYFNTFYNAGIRKLIAVDASIERLKKAQETLFSMEAQWIAPIILHKDLRVFESHVDELDCVCLLCVLHHLDSVGKGVHSFIEATHVCRRALSVLKPGGLLIVGTTTPEQLDPYSGSLWYYRYFVEGARYLQKRYPSLHVLGTILNEAGAEIQSVNKIDQISYARESLDASAPFKKSFRDTDSVFSWYDNQPGVLHNALEKLSEDISSGRVAQHLAESVRLTAECGQGYIVASRKRT